MVQYYVFPAPCPDLFANLDMDDVKLPQVRPFAELRCSATKYTKGMTLDEVKKKILAQWLKELDKPHKSFKVTREMAQKALQDCLHAYVVLDDTAKMLLELKKSCNLFREDAEEYAFYERRLFSYLNMLICMRAEGTWVEILTDGKERWLTSENQQMRDAALLINKNHMIYHRLTDKPTSEKT